MGDRGLGPRCDSRLGPRWSGPAVVYGVLIARKRQAPCGCSQEEGEEGGATEGAERSGERSRVHSRAVDEDGNPIKFTSKILPPYLRRTKSIEELIPWLYLRPISTNDFSERVPVGNLSVATL